MENILDFISPSDTLFYETKSGLLCLKYKGEDIGRVSVLRMFPFMYEVSYGRWRKFPKISWKW